MNLCADGPGLEAGEQMLGLRFDDHPVPNRVQRLLLRGAAPAILSGAGLGFDKGVEGVLLSVFGQNQPVVCG